MQLELIRAAEFVRVGPEGAFDLPASKRLLAALAAACRKRGVHHALIDLRQLQPGAKPVFRPADVLELVRTFSAVGFDPARLRLAVLYRTDPHKRARLFAFLGTLHGWQVRAFGGFEEAFAWLLRGPVATRKPAAGSDTFSVRVRRAGRRTAVAAEPAVLPVAVGPARAQGGAGRVRKC